VHLTADPEYRIPRGGCDASEMASLVPPLREQAGIGA
jgi:hypothetical protein